MSEAHYPGFIGAISRKNLAAKPQYLPTEFFAGNQLFISLISHAERYVRFAASNENTPSAANTGALFSSRLRSHYSSKAFGRILDIEGGIYPSYARQNLMSQPGTMGSKIFSSYLESGVNGMKYCFVASLFLFLGSGYRNIAAEHERLPNIVLIFADDLGYGDVGIYGARGYKTPNIDRLAEEGRRFTSFYVAQPVCSASRAALLTGCYPNRIGIYGALGPNSTIGIHSNEVTLAELVKQKGYATAIVGKWHLGYQPQFLPTRHGFDQYYGLPYSNDMWPFHPEAKKGTYPDLPLIDKDQTIALNPDQTQLTRQYTERAVQFISQKKNQPFFLYLAHSMPHVPIFASEKFRGKTRRGLFGDVIEEIDWSVGEVMKALRSNALAENTLVIFTSDNGPWLSYGDHAGSAGGLREGKGTVWEGGVREPCIAWWPGRIPKGTVTDEPAMTLDIFPTIARLIDAPLPPHPIDGKDIWPVMSGAPGAASPHEAYFFYYNVNDLLAVRSGKWKLLVPQEYRSLNGRPGGKNGIPTKYETLKTDLALYNLETDRSEQTNLVASHPEVVSRLQGLLAREREELGDHLTGAKGKNVREPGRAPKKSG